MNHNIRTSYKLYKKFEENPVEIKEYIDITLKFIKFILKKVFEGNTVVLPSGLGDISIIGKKPNIKYDEKGNIVSGLAPDWVKTKKLRETNEKAKIERKIVYHTNFHTDGYRYKFVWSKKRVLIKNKTLYSLRFTRSNKRSVNNYIVKGFNYITK